MQKNICKNSNEKFVSHLARRKYRDNESGETSKKQKCDKYEDFCSIEKLFKEMSNEKYILLMRYTKEREKENFNSSKKDFKENFLHPLSHKSYISLKNIVCEFSNTQNIINMNDEVHSLLKMYLSIEQKKRSQGFFQKLDPNVILYIFSYLDDENYKLEFLRNFTGLSSDVLIYYSLRESLKIRSKNPSLNYLSLHKSIKNLDISFCNFESFLESLSIFKVENLTIGSRFPFKRVNYSNFIKFESLKIVCDDENRNIILNDDALSFIIQNNNLKSLIIDCRINVKSLKIMSALSNLINLDLRKLSYSYDSQNEDFIFLERMNNLETLIVEEENEGCDGSSRAFSLIIERLPDSVKKLHMKHEFDDYDDDEMEILFSKSNIEDLYISTGIFNRFNVDQTSEISDASHFSKLHSLTIADKLDSNLNVFGDFAHELKRFLKNSKNMRKLNLIGQYITKVGLKYVISCSNLEDITLSYDEGYYYKCEEEEIGDFDDIYISPKEFISCLISAGWDRNIKININTHHDSNIDFSLLEEFYPKLKVYKTRKIF